LIYEYEESERKEVEEGERRGGVSLLFSCDERSTTTTYDVSDILDI